MRWRWGMILLLWVAGAWYTTARGQAAPSAAVKYWEQQTPTTIRDTTLIRLYTAAADRTGNLDSSLILLQKGFQIALRLRSSPWLAFTHNHIGLVYLRKGISFKAIEYLFKGLQYAELAADPDQQAFSWNYIGDCYANLKSYEKAIAAESRAIQLYETLGNNSALTQALIDLGAMYRESNRLDESIDALKKILAAGFTAQNQQYEITTYHNLAATYLKKEDFANAGKYGLLAMERQIDGQGRASTELLSLLSLIKSHENDSEQALAYAAKAEFYLNYEWPIAREKTAFTLFEAYKVLQRPDTALKWHEKYVALRENNLAETQKKRIEVLRYEYDAQQRNRQMQDMATDIARQRRLQNGLILGILLFLLLAAALFRNNRLLQKRQNELDAANLRLTEVGHLLQQTNATLEERVAHRTNELREANDVLTRKNHEIQEALFQGQSIERKRVAAELHDNLGSLLSGIKWRLESVDSDTLSPTERTLYHSVVRLISDAYNQVRHISHNLLPSILEREGLIPALKRLVEDLNRTGKARFEMTYSSSLRIEDKKVAFELYSCALELMNNILKHAHASQILLEVIQTQHFHVLVVTDNGVGLKSSPTAGSGLANIRQRVSSLSGNLSIRTLKNSKGTSITLRIPRQPVAV